MAAASDGGRLHRPISSLLLRFGDSTTGLRVVFSLCEAKSFQRVSGQSKVPTCFSSGRKCVPATQQAGGPQLE